MIWRKGLVDQECQCRNYPTLPYSEFEVYIRKHLISSTQLTAFHDTNVNVNTGAKFQFIQSCQRCRCFHLLTGSFWLLMESIKRNDHVRCHGIYLDFPEDERRKVRWGRIFPALLVCLTKAYDIREFSLPAVEFYMYIYFRRTSTFAWNSCGVRSDYPITKVRSRPLVCLVYRTAFVSPNENN